MPSRNRVKQYMENGYYHVYNRGVNKQKIFKDDEDYRVFLNLFKRYLNDAPTKDNKGREYPWLRNDVELLAYCLMPNHFHLLIFQIDRNAMTKLLRGVCTAYAVYFNKKYSRTGTLFQDVFKASLISNEGYLQHITRYIHLNPTKYLEWEYSSLRYYLSGNSAAWLNPKLVLDVFGSQKSYARFLEDYEDQKRMIEVLKHELADSNVSRVGPWKQYRGEG